MVNNVPQHIYPQALQESNTIRIALLIFAGGNNASCHDVGIGRKYSLDPCSSLSSHRYEGYHDEGDDVVVKDNDGNTGKSIN